MNMVKEKVICAAFFIALGVIMLIGIFVPETAVCFSQWIWKFDFSDCLNDCPTKKDETC